MPSRAPPDFFANGASPEQASAKIMTAPGLTHGSFYNHFDSKEDLPWSRVTFGA